MRKMAKLLGLLVVVASSACVSAATIDVTDGLVYGHCYLGWDNPQAFSLGDTSDVYMSSNFGIGGSNDYGTALAVNPGTTADAPGYAIYKFVAPAGTSISSIDLFVNTYYNNGGGAGKMDVYYSTTDFSGTPDFSSGWNNLNYGYQQWGYSQTMTFAPQANAVYVAYVGWNGGGANWELQVMQDQATFTVVPEPVSLLLMGMGVAGLIRRRK